MVMTSSIPFGATCKRNNNKKSGQESIHKAVVHRDLHALYLARRHNTLKLLQFGRPQRTQGLPGPMTQCSAGEINYIDQADLLLIQAMQGRRNKMDDIMSAHEIHLDSFPV